MKHIFTIGCMACFFVFGGFTAQAQTPVTNTTASQTSERTRSVQDIGPPQKVKTKFRNRYDSDQAGYLYEYDRDTFNESGAGIQYLDPQNMGKGVPSTATQTIDMR